MSSVLVAIAMLCQVAPARDAYMGQVREYQVMCHKQLVECVIKKGGNLDFALFQCVKEGVHE